MEEMYKCGRGPQATGTNFSGTLVYSCSEEAVYIKKINEQFLIAQ